MEEKEFKFWINNYYYFKTQKEESEDDTGDYYRTLFTDTAEGALGYIIKLHHRDNKDDDPDNNEFWALKIPKLTGATLRENAYIDELMRQEVLGVRRVGQNNDGLLEAKFENVLREPIQTSNEYNKKFNDGLLLVKCEIGRNPVFCLLKSDNTYHPDGTAHPIDEVFGFSSDDKEKLKFNKIRESSKAGDFLWETTTFLVSRSAEKAIFNQSEASQSNLVTNLTWYACVPSIAYKWAKGSLQESIGFSSKRVDNEGNTVAHFFLKARDFIEFTKIICRGLRNLHARKMIHGDLRPANILYTGKLNDPTSYQIADYGSFAFTPEVSPVPANNNPQLTSLGPITTGERASIFYAPERIKGNENELANKAYFLIDDPQTTNSLWIVLGWDHSGEQIDIDGLKKKVGFPNSRQTPKDDGRKKENETTLSKKLEEEELEEQIIASDQNDEGKNENLQTNEIEENNPVIRLTEAEALLQKGDFLRIQDYVFQLEAPEEAFESYRIYKCDPKLYWKISHGRIAFDDMKSSVLPIELNLDRVIESQQWSAATDLYSLGILLLYVIFRNSGLDHQGNMKNEKLEESRFHQMMLNVTSEQFLNAIWLDIEPLRYEIEKKRKERRNEDLGTIKVNLSQYSTDDEDSREEELKEATRRIINWIIQNSPGVEVLVQELNYSRFIFLFHFALCCIHRRNSLDDDVKAKIQHIESSPSFPFCESRVDAPAPNGAAEKALERLKDIQEIIGDIRLDDLNLSQKGLDDMPRARKRSIYSLRVEIADNERELRRSKEEIENLKIEITNLSKSMPEGFVDYFFKYRLGDFRQLKKSLDELSADEFLPDESSS